MALTDSARSVGGGIAALYRRYAAWLVSITWKRFIVLSVLLMIVAGILSGIPPFSWELSTTTKRVPTSRSVDITADEHGVRIKPKARRSQAPEITIDEHGIQIRRKGDPAAGKPPREIIIDERGVQVLPRSDGEERPAPPPSSAPESKSLADDIRREVADELAGEIRREIIESLSHLGEEERVVRVRLGDHLPPLAFLFIMLSAVMKVAYAGRAKAEAQAAQAQHVADEESLKRQVVEARMAAMQAQVEPHFLFNTLASIDHLIEVDPPRASKMQKNLIALLRASMPAMREKATSLGRELEVVRPYLEILKVRMEDRLHAEVGVPEGLYSADFPPMMLQSLVENAIKHGLEPKAEGGALTVSAEVAHGKLVVTVADTGVGFAVAPTAGTGTGLANIRERLKLAYGDAAELRIAQNTPAGTRASIVVPYKAT